MNKLINAFYLIVSISIFGSCIDEFDFSTDNLSSNIEQNTDIAIPLVNASFTLDEMLPTDESINRYLIIDDKNFITLAYNYEFASYPAADFFNGTYSGTVLPYITETVGPETIDVGLNKLLNQGEFFIADPRITVSIINYWNIPAQFKMIDLFYYEEENSPAKPITGDIVNNWYTVKKPLSPGESAITELVLNNTNSNIADVLSAMPHRITFSSLVETITTPVVPYSINPNSVDSVRLKIEVPFDFRITNLVLSDTSKADLTINAGYDSSMVNSIQVNLLVDNGFPISLGAQVYFADENYVIMDSISNTKIVIPSATTSLGKVTARAESMNTILVDKAKLASLLKAKFFISKISFNTANAAPGETVKIFSDYEIGLKIGARLKLKIDI